MLWCTGFGHGLATPVTSGGGLASAVSGAVSVVANPMGGDAPYALRSNSAGAAAYIQKTLASADYHVGSFYFYFKDALPSADDTIWRDINADADIAFYFESADSKIYAGKVGLLGAVPGPVITYNTRYRIDYRCFTAGSTHTIEWEFAEGDEPGTPQTTFSVGSRSSVQMTGDRVGNSATTADTYFTDVVVVEDPAAYPIGPHGVKGLRPASDGTHNNAANIMEDSAGNDIHATNYPAYSYLDEDPWVSTANADYVRQTANGTGNYVEVLFATMPDVTIIGAMALLQYASASSTANTGGCIVIDEDAAATTVWGAPGALADYSESSAFYKSVVLPTPSGGWDAAAVNALKARMGYSDDANPDPYWLAMMLEVAYEIVTGEQHSGSAAASGGGSVAAAGKKTGKGSATVSALGAVAALGVAAMLGLASAGGAGRAVATGYKTANAPALASAVGETVAVGGIFEEHEGPAAAVGGGGAVATSYKKGLGAGALSGRGEAVAGGRKTAQAAAAVTSRGAIASTGTKSASGSAEASAQGQAVAVGTAEEPELHAGTGAVAGGGAAIASGRKEAQVAGVVAGSGGAVAGGSKSVAGVSVASAGPASVALGHKRASAAAAVSGGGSVSAEGHQVVIEEHSGAAVVSGGGGAVAYGVKGIWQTDCAAPAPAERTVEIPASTRSKYGKVATRTAEMNRRRTWN